MIVRLSDLYNREVICVRDGARLGTIGDVVIDIESGNVSSVIIYGRTRFFGIFGREDDIVIKWEDIEVLGDETVLVKSEIQAVPRKKEHRFLSNFLD